MMKNTNRKAGLVSDAVCDCNGYERRRKINSDEDAGGRGILLRRQYACAFD